VKRFLKFEFHRRRVYDGNTQAKACLYNRRRNSSTKSQRRFLFHVTISYSYFLSYRKLCFLLCMVRSTVLLHHRDTYEVTNDDFLLFVNETGYATDSERFGWSFVFKVCLLFVFLFMPQAKRPTSSLFALCLPRRRLRFPLKS